MNDKTTTPNPSNAGNVSIPQGWKAEWSAQYGRYFYINLSTNESTWNLPATTPVHQTQQSIQRKPVPGQTLPSPAQNQASAPVAQRAYIEGYPTPPPQVSGGYFPTITAPQPQKQPQYTQLPKVVQHPQSQYNQSPLAQQHHNPQQQHPQAILHQQQQPPCAQSPLSGQPQYSPSISQQSSAPLQQQARNYTPPSATPSSSGPLHAQQPVQTFSPPPTPGTLQSTSYALSPYPQQPQTYAQQSIHLLPQQRQQPPQQYLPQQQQQYQQPQQQYQQPQQQYQKQPHKRSSMMPASLMSNPIMSKMTTKFSTLQKGAPPTSTHPNGKPPADWKKWSKRAAIGVAGIGAVALGMDAAGDMFSGAEGLASGGGDFSGGDFTAGSEGVDAQTAVDANYTELAIAGMGQDNASMLADPVGTTYVFENAQATQGAAGLI
ncbi:hypothetical protein BDU57DRAFT_172443 [Ampelomyces quisqualis]|uniref:WW domain-containing protein n=1 Tax=Ampelomyces quisqualis TaxID=50730 RepID=A0A6A5QPS2_AMPQU|nr:hypothetical protein BDU57DRAFT_172443 [Ampelomyces quisqualis]